MEQSLTITESAARRVRQIIAAEGNEALMLRVTVTSGGCSGFQVGFDLDAEVHDGDQVFEAHGVRYVADEASLELLVGAEVDFVDDLMGQAFRVNNPSASASCGCGVSFAL